MTSSRHLVNSALINSCNARLSPRFDMRRGVVVPAASRLHSASAMRNVVALAVLLAPSLAAAERSELTELSPSTLEPGEVRVGLFDVGVGLWGTKLLERIELSSHHFVWSTWAAGLPSYDLRGKFEFWREGNFSMSASAGITAIDLQPIVDPDDPDTQLAFRIVPIEGWAGYRIGDRLRLSTGAVYTHVSLAGHTKAGPIDELGGAVGTSNLEVEGSAELRVSKSWYVIASGRVLGYQEQYAYVRGDKMIGDADQGDVSNETRVEGDALGVGGARTASLAVHLARAHFNLRLGVEVGNRHIPLVNLVTPNRGWMPVFDLYWRI